METNHAQNQKLHPNTTQIPHIIIREWLPLLKDVELRVLLIVADQTLGWLEDAETGRRKEKDWISRGQLMEKTGRSAKHITEAIKTLVEKWQIVEALDEQGRPLDTAAKRKMTFGKIFYRLNLKHPQPTLFGKPTRKLRVIKRHTDQKGENNDRVTKGARRKGHTTKETVLQKEIQAKAGKPDQDEKTGKSQAQQDQVNQPKPPARETLPTTPLIAAFKRYAEEIRHESPQFERGKDGNLIKAALRHLNRQQLELLFLWFLTERKKMGTTIGAALCKETLQGFIDATRSEYGFYGRMEQLWREHNKQTPDAAPDTFSTAARIRQLKQALLERMSAGR